MFKNPFSFEGRIRRTEYGLSHLIYFGAAFCFVILSGILKIFLGKLTFLAFIIPLFWFMIAQRTKRCHDVGNSGWFQLIPFYSLWLFIADSDRGHNKYGPNPKGIENYNSINEIGKKEY